MSIDSWCAQQYSFRLTDWLRSIELAYIYIFVIDIACNLKYSLHFCGEYTSSQWIALLVWQNKIFLGVTLTLGTCVGQHITMQHNDDIKEKRTEVAAYCSFTKIDLVSKPAATKKAFLLPSSDSTLTQTTLPLPTSCVHSLSSGCKQRWVFITQTISLVTQPDTWQWCLSSESRILDLM